MTNAVVIAISAIAQKPEKKDFRGSVGFEPVASALAQLVEHCSANVAATCSNPVEAPKMFFFFVLLPNCSPGKLRLKLQWSHLRFICISAVHFISFYEKAFRK